jgi:hypothetical protein
MAYRYDEFKWLASMSGFNYPVDVYWDTIYLGLIEATPEGFVIRMVDTPMGKVAITQSPKNMFKSQDLAAKVLHRTWKVYRSGGNEGDEEDDQTPVPA